MLLFFIVLTRFKLDNVCGFWWVFNYVFYTGHFWNEIYKKKSFKIQRNQLI